VDINSIPNIGTILRRTYVCVNANQNICLNSFDK